MRNIYANLLREAEKPQGLALATLLDTRGSVPQVRGATALFSTDGLVAGTLGGGVLEADATCRAGEAIRNDSRVIYEVDLNADIESKEAAICGGSALVLIDACLKEGREVFLAMEQSVQQGRSGILLTTIGREPGMMIERHWFERASGKYRQEMRQCLDERKCLYLPSSEGDNCFFEPVFPLPALIIAGAGHIGKALAHFGRLLDFEVTVIDDRADHANAANIPDADHLVVGPVGRSLQKLAGSPESYIVIVTRGHKDDAEALKACLDSGVAYIGMIGSKRKISLMREEFISRGWATPSQFDLVHAPIGLEIGSETVQEIAVSISAELVQERHQRHGLRKRTAVTAIILAAGTSSRMGKPKLLLPYGGSTVIGTVITEVLASTVRNAIVVLGADHESHQRAIGDFPVGIVHNKHFRDGMLSSVKCGLDHIPETAEAVMILLGDQPMVTSDEMDRLIESYGSSEKEILIASHANKRGHPLLIGRKFISEIKGFSGESSLRDLLEIHPDEILEIQTENESILRDIDTEKDYLFELKHHHRHD